MIIGINGYATVGKDQVARFIQEIQPEKNWQVKKFSGKLKTIASMLTGIPASLFEDQDFKASNLGPEWSSQFVGEGLNTITQEMSVREFLQRLGTDAVRNGLHKNAWVNALMADYSPINEPDMITDTGVKVYDASSIKMPNWIITDVRFPNEAQAVVDKGGVIVRIDRPGINPVNAHPSETALDNWYFDYKIANVSDLVSLRQTVEVLLKRIYE